MKNFGREYSNISLTNVLKIMRRDVKYGSLLIFAKWNGKVQRSHVANAVVDLGPVRRKVNGQQRSQVTNAVAD